jgi:hypothetical protein
MATAVAGTLSPPELRHLVISGLAAEGVEETFSDSTVKLLRAD